MGNNEYSIQDLLQREVYVNDQRVGRIVGERHHPNTSRATSIRLEVEPSVAQTYMRKPSELAPLAKELVQGIQADGTVKLSKSMRELQRRWRDTVRIDERLYAPDEMIDKAVLDNQGQEIGVIMEMIKVKRTYRGFTVKLRMGIQRVYGMDEQINIPLRAFARTRERLDEVILSKTFDKLLEMPSFIDINSPGFGMD